MAKLVRIKAGDGVGPGAWHSAGPDRRPVCRLAHGWPWAPVENGESDPTCGWCLIHDRAINPLLAGMTPRPARNTLRELTPEEHKERTDRLAAGGRRALDDLKRGMP